MASRTLLGASLVSALGGIAVAVAGVFALEQGRIPDAPGGLGFVFVFAGFVSFFIGLYGLLVYATLARPQPWVDHLATAEQYAASGRLEYARTYYEEAVRWGADPADVQARLASVEAASERTALHRRASP